MVSPTLRTSGTVDNLNSITWNGYKFIAVGGGGTTLNGWGTILTSTDGIVWTTQTSGIPLWLYSISCDLSKCVAVGDLGKIITSTDGITWISQAPATVSTLYGITWNGTKFVAVGGGGTGGIFRTILTSADGLSWAVQTATSSTASMLYGVTWNGSKFVAVGDLGQILISP